VPLVKFVTMVTFIPYF